MSTVAKSRTKSGNAVTKFLARLQDIKIGGGSGGLKVPRKQLTAIISNLVTLVSNGLSLPKSLTTLAREPSFKAYAGMFDDMRARMEAGETFSSTLARYPATFKDLMVHQIKVGERSGTVTEALTRIGEQLEKASKIRAMIIKRLSYPAIILGVGAAAITFMITFIIPVFEKTYKDAKIPLPFVTTFLIGIAHFFYAYGWMIPICVVGGVYGWKALRKNPLTAATIDHVFLRLPFVGPWIRDIAVLQFIEVLGTMMDSGFKVADALGVAADSVSNRSVRKAVHELQAAVRRGEKLSREIEKHGDLFPPIVSQLVIVGEQTGKLASTTSHVRSHLEKQIERKTDMLVGTIEPVLTISLAFAIGTVLLAIYLPMFDMINTVGKG